MVWLGGLLAGEALEPLSLLVGVRHGQPTGRGELLPGLLGVQSLSGWLSTAKPSPS